MRGRPWRKLITAGQCNRALESDGIISPLARLLTWVANFLPVKKTLTPSFTTRYQKKLDETKLCPRYSAIKIIRIYQISNAGMEGP